MPDISGSAADQGRGAPIAGHEAWRHRLARLLVLLTLGLIFVGGLVTSTGSGLSVPDWPLSYGMLMPPMVGGVLYEHSHRLVAGSVGLLTLGLAVWTALAETRALVRRLAWLALGVVIAQGVLGGLTVLFLLPTPISVMHACLAQVFLCVTIALAYATSAEWHGPGQALDAGALSASAAATTVVFCQLLLGALMRHLGAGLAIPDFPRAFGRWLPPFVSTGVTIHFMHRLGAVCVLAAVLWQFLEARRAGDPRLVRPAGFAVVLVLAQIALGGATILSGKAVLPTTLHVATGAAILGTCFFLALRTRRLLKAPASESAGGLRPSPVES